MIFDKNSSISWLVVTLAIVLGVMAGGMYAYRGDLKNSYIERDFRVDVPEAKTADEVKMHVPMPNHPASAEAETPLLLKEGKEALVLAGDINLAVPFAPQAPSGNWEQPYQDACEEATIIMVERFLRGQSLSLTEMDTEILKMVDFQNENYGFFKDSNIAETVRLVNEYYTDLQATASYDVTAEDIKQELMKGNPVVVLVNGQLLGNPFYTAPGPDRHTLVIKGMAEGKFITNDPGTRRGADFAYDVETVLNAMVDYDGGTPGTGKKGMIVIEQPV